VCKKEKVAGSMKEKVAGVGSSGDEDLSSDGGVGEVISKSGEFAEEGSSKAGVGSGGDEDLSARGAGGEMISKIGENGVGVAVAEVVAVGEKQGEDLITGDLAGDLAEAKAPKKNRRSHRNGRHGKCKSCKSEVEHIPTPSRNEFCGAGEACQRIAGEAVLALSEPDQALVDWLVPDLPGGPCSLANSGSGLEFDGSAQNTIEAVYLCPDRKPTEKVMESDTKCHVVLDAGTPQKCDEAWFSGQRSLQIARERFFSTGVGPRVLNSACDELDYILKSAPNPDRATGEDGTKFIQDTLRSNEKVLEVLEKLLATNAKKSKDEDSSFAGCV